MHRGRVASWVVGLLLIVAASVNARELRILTSFLPLYCFTANVAGPVASVEMLLPSNVEPHDYQLTVKDRARIEGADLVILHGAGLDNWLAAALEGTGRPVLIISSAVSKELIYTGTRPNPHFWLDPTLAIRCVTNIVEVLTRLDPEKSALYVRNGSNYIARLQALDAELEGTLAPVRGRSFVTFHDSFAYFARRYELRIPGVIELVPEVSPSPRYLTGLYRVIREAKASCIFIEPQFRSSLAQMVAEDLHLPLGTLNTIETGPPNPRSYEVGMQQNGRTLLERLK